MHEIALLGSSVTANCTSGLSLKSKPGCKHSAVIASSAEIELVSKAACSNSKNAPPEFLTETRAIPCPS